MARKAPVPDGLNIIGKAWGEVKKINWHEVNRLCQQNFHIGLVGSEPEIAAMKAWLLKFPYLATKTCNMVGVKIHEKDMDQHVTVITKLEDGLDEKLVKSTTFCLTGPGMASEVRRMKGEVYIFDEDANYSLTTQILSNHNEVQFALAHTFPVFRPELAQSVIQDTAFQNAAWALLTGLPSALPGPHHILTSPFEGISDFTVLTLNEIKLMFELVGLSGYRVVPLYHLVEFGIILGLGKLAQSIAMTTLGRLPVRAAFIAKGAIAYAFTWTIGEAIFFYIATGHKLSRDAVSGNFRRHFARGKDVASELACQVH